MLVGAGVGIGLLIIVAGMVWVRRTARIPDPGTITIGTETWPGYIALYVARDKGFFKDAGVDVVIKRYKELGKLSQDYVAGAMQGRANLTLDAVNEALNGFDHKTVAIIDYSTGADAIVARSSVRTLNDLKGKRVAFDPGSLEEFFISWALKKARLSITDITPIVASPEVAAQLLARGEVDVAVSHEPFLSQIIGTRSDIHVLVSSKDAPGLITDILTFRSDFIERYPQSVTAILGAYFRAIDFIAAYPQESATILAQEFGITPDDATRDLTGLHLLTLPENREAVLPGYRPTSLYQHFADIGRFVAAHRARAEKLNTDLLIDPTFVRSMTPPARTEKPAY